MIAGIAKGNDRASIRIKGVKQAVKDYGKKTRLLKVVEASYSQTVGGDAFAQLVVLPLDNYGFRNYQVGGLLGAVGMLLSEHPIQTRAFRITAHGSCPGFAESA